MIHVLVTCYNREPFLATCMDSILAQSVNEFIVWLLVEPSTDRTLEMCRGYLCEDDRIRVITNDRRFGQCGNYDQVIRRDDIDDDDICIAVDGDDHLPDPAVFQRVLDAYADADGRTWMTWGSYAALGTDGSWELGCAEPVDVDNIRTQPWNVSHLRTWKAFLWRAIKDADLRDPETGWYWLAGADAPFVFPMCELAGCGHARFLRDINYIYNIHSPLNEYKTHPQEQKRTERLIRAMPRYWPLKRSVLVRGGA